MSKNKGRLVPKAEVSSESSEPTETDAVVDSPTPEPEPTPEVVPEPVAATGKPSDRLGLGLCGLSPMRRMDFQDALLEANREMRLTDHQLALCMMAEHPWGCAIPDHYVVGIRRLYNAGTHTKHQVRPAVPVPAFDEAGNVTTRRARKLAQAVGAEPILEPLTPAELGAEADGE